MNGLVAHPDAGMPTYAEKLPLEVLTGRVESGPWHVQRR